MPRTLEYMPLDIEGIRAYLGAVVFHYEKTAPVVSQYADDLYIRLAESPESINLTELLQIKRLHVESDDGWEPANYAQNRIYKLLGSLSKDTTGIIDF